MGNTDIKLENYIIDNDSICNDSICREERQYALFLNNILLKYRKPCERTDSAVTNIFAACGLPADAEIKYVFYEATFMRDLRLDFEKNRSEDSDSFNAVLVRYVTGLYPYNGKNCFLGAKEKATHLFETLKKALTQDEEAKIKKWVTTIKSMMNSKPDIAVIYRHKDKDDEQKYLLLLECKFESRESSDKGGNKQRIIQGMIADFLCENYFKDELAVSPAMADAVNKDNKTYRSPLVQFERDAATDPENKIINITDLIRLNNKIFGI